MIAPVLALSRVDRVLTATLCRPPVNALDATVIDALQQAIDLASADEDIAVLHLRSDQKAFCAGADLALMHECFATREGTRNMVVLVERMQRVFAALENAPVVSIAEIGGAAIGGGLELALACDLRVAATEAKLGLSEARLGLLPAAGGTQRLTRVAGVGTAKRLILTAELVDGREASHLGLVQWCRPRVELFAFAADLAQRIAAHPKAALVANKRCIAAESDPWSDGFAEEVAATRRLYQEAETRRKVVEFLAGSAR
ncbi:MAG TPA: enoyl-CoA hydratase/isomerase family protein [Casimicrobiaceae bacterium]|nr:enoyl-CoA hydratase/isomerase family protein [Casimicrobiaceae bacterium]